ncbi:hypothetical protein EJB05_34244, partial [Eragrostis curvula]
MDLAVMNRRQVEEELNPVADPPVWRAVALAIPGRCVVAFHTPPPTTKKRPWPELSASQRSGGPRKKAVSRSVKTGLDFLVGRIDRYLKRGRYALRISAAAPIYLAAVQEYLAAAVLIHPKSP